MADLQNDRTHARICAIGCTMGAAGDAGLYRGYQFVDAAGASNNRRTMVFPAEHCLPMARSPYHFGSGGSYLARHTGVAGRTGVFYSLVLSLLAYAGLGISLWPYAIPESVTIWQAAGAPDTLIFVGVGTAIILPLTLAYLAYAHWIFRDKVEGGYGHN
jgi:cytochrome bd-type quinol oxidase subunit 2